MKGQLFAPFSISFLFDELSLVAAIKKIVFSIPRYPDTQILFTSSDYDIISSPYYFYRLRQETDKHTPHLHPHNHIIPHTTPAALTLRALGNLSKSFTHTPVKGRT